MFYLKPFSEVLAECDSKVRVFLREHPELMDIPPESPALCGCIFVLKNEYTIELESWLREKNILSTFEKMEREVRKKLKDEKFVSKRNPLTGKLELKKGVLTMGTFSPKNIHTVMAGFGMKESDTGYYIAAFLMNCPERKEIIMLSEILQKF